MLQEPRTFFCHLQLFLVLWHTAVADFGLLFGIWGYIFVCGAPAELGSVTLGVFPSLNYPSDQWRWSWCWVPQINHIYFLGQALDWDWCGPMGSAPGTALGLHQYFSAIPRASSESVSGFQTFVGFFFCSGMGSRNWEMSLRNSLLTQEKIPAETHTWTLDNVLWPSLL